ncbi:MAG: hypothetical protein ACLQLH_09665 [Terracidiphilus sp.]
MRRLLRLLMLAMRRQKHVHEVWDHRTRQCLRKDKREQNQRQQDGAVEGEGRKHPVAAAGADGAVGFEGGVFKHGLPPRRSIQPRRLGDRNLRRDRACRSALSFERGADPQGDPFIPIGTTVLV